MTYASFVKSSVICVLLASLAACGGGGGSVTTDPAIPGPAGPDQVPGTTSGLRGAATDLLNDWAPGTLPDYTPLAAVPASGSASYDGYLYGALSTRDDTVTGSVIGRLTLNVGFTASSAGFTGSATDFVDGSDDPFTGTLTVSGGALDRTGNPANDATVRGVSVAGTLRDSGGTDHIYGIQLEGDFLGDRAEAIGGEAIGRVTTGSVSQDFDGGFVVED